MKRIVFVYPILAVALAAGLMMLRSGSTLNRKAEEEVSDQKEIPTSSEKKSLRSSQVPASKAKGEGRV